MHGLLLWLSHTTGLDNINGASYAFWSGIGSDLGELTILGFIINWYRKHREHMKVHREHMERMEAMNGWQRQSPWE